MYWMFPVAFETRKVAAVTAVAPQCLSGFFGLSGEISFLAAPAHFSLTLNPDSARHRSMSRQARSRLVQSGTAGDFPWTRILPPEPDERL